MRRLLWAVLALALASGCTTVDLSGAPTKSPGVGHIFERLPATAKVGSFRDATPDRTLAPALLARCTESFALSLRRTELFEKVVTGGGDRAEIGFDAEVLSYHCTRNYGFIWAFYSAFAVIAVPANLPLSIDEGEYEVSLKSIDVASGRALGTYRARFFARSWRGAWSLFETFMSEPEQLFDKVNYDLIRAVVDEYPKLQAAARPGESRGNENLAPR